MWPGCQPPCLPHTTYAFHTFSYLYPWQLYTLWKKEDFKLTICALTVTFFASLYVNFGMRQDQGLYVYVCMAFMTLSNWHSVCGVCFCHALLAFKTLRKGQEEEGQGQGQGWRSMTEFQELCPWLCARAGLLTSSPWLPPAPCPHAADGTKTQTFTRGLSWTPLPSNIASHQPQQFSYFCWTDETFCRHCTSLSLPKTCSQLELLSSTAFSPLPHTRQSF